MTDLLLIDDNRMFVFGLAMSLRKEGFSVITALNGEEGVKLAQQHHPELILCDILMPLYSGLKVKETLNNETSTSDIPFIFISAFSEPANKNRGLQIGADDFLEKPFGLDDLITRINIVINRKIREENRSRSECQKMLNNLESSLPIHVGHLFRTQLGILRLSLDMLRKKPLETDKYLEFAIGSANRTKMIIETLIWLNEFDLGRFETFSQQIDLEINITLQINEIFEIWKEKKLQLELTIDKNCLIYAPIQPFTLALSHLVDNACKYSPLGGIVKINVKACGNRGCIITIQDEGPGILVQFRKMVFDRFFQITENLELTKENGMGLGLFLARSFARTRGGDVNILETFTGCLVEMVLP
jgi:two-component system sensor histidine kinase/response regulator